MKLEEIEEVLTSIGFRKDPVIINDGHTYIGISSMTFYGAIYGRDFLYLFGPNKLNNDFIVMKHQKSISGSNYVSLRVDGLKKIEDFISTEFTKQYKEWKRMLLMKNQE